MTGDYAVEVEGLTVRFGDFTAVDHVSFTVKRGEIFGFLGANGAGKTTTIRALCGLIVPNEGRVVVGGHDAAFGLGPIKSKVGYMSQRFTLYNDLTVEENLAFAASLRKMPEAALKARTRELFEVIGFDRSPQTLVKDLAGGFKQEVSLAAAMLHDPEMVFLDEPTSGVAPAARVRFWNLIRRIAGTGKTVFVTTHYMDEAEQCGRIALMRDGKLIALDTSAGLKASTFREPLFEVEAGPGAPAGWLDALRADAAVDDVRAYGLRQHVGVVDRPKFDALLRKLGGVTAKPIPPSLEDVFLRLVEGPTK